MELTDKQGEVYRAIQEALENKNLDEVKRLIEENPEMLHLGEDSDSWIHISIMYEYLEGVEYFFSKGLDINFRADADYNKTALSEAAFKRELKIIQFLIENGATFDTSTYLRNPLIGCIWNLVTPKEHCIDDPDKATPFATAKYLIDNGIDVSLKYTGGNISSSLDPPAKYVDKFIPGMGAYEFALERADAETADYIMQKLDETLGKGVYIVDTNPYGHSQISIDHPFTFDWDDVSEFLDGKFRDNRLEYEKLFKDFDNIPENVQALLDEVDIFEYTCIDFGVNDPKVIDGVPYQNIIAYFSLDGVKNGKTIIEVYFTNIDILLEAITEDEFKLYKSECLEIEFVPYKDGEKGEVIKLTR